MKNHHKEEYGKIVAEKEVKKHKALQEAEKAKSAFVPASNKSQAMQIRDKAEKPPVTLEEHFGINFCFRGRAHRVEKGTCVWGGGLLWGRRET